MSCRREDIIVAAVMIVVAVVIGATTPMWAPWVLEDFIPGVINGARAFWALSSW